MHKHAVSFFSFFGGAGTSAGLYLAFLVFFSTSHAYILVLAAFMVFFIIVIFSLHRYTMIDTLVKYINIFSKEKLSFHYPVGI